MRPGQPIAVIEAMKMEHLVAAPQGGIVSRHRRGSWRHHDAGEPILFIEPAEIEEHDADEEEDIDLDASGTISPK